MLDQVVTLIAGPSEALEPALLDEARDALFKLGAEIGRPDWLGADRACDLAFTDLNADQAEAAIRQLLGSRPVDVVAQPAADRRKRLLLADLESTLIRNEMLDELADLAGCGAEIAAVTRQAMNGEIDFEQAIKARVGLLAGLPIESLEAAAERIELMPGAATLIRTMRQAGAVTVMVSGGFHYFADPIAARLGIDQVFANVLNLEGGTLAGTVGHPILGREAKYEKLTEIAAELELPLSLTLAVGDGANDLRMIEAAGLGIAFHAKPFVQERARWRIDHADLTALLYAQGYRQDEFA